jgi:transcriptional regulator with XRE-family HTH domain
VINKRIKEILLKKGISQGELADKWKVSRQYINAILSGNGSIGIKLINKLIDEFPDLNLNWLLTGKGVMFFESRNTMKEPEAEYSANSDLLKSKEEIVQVQRDYIEQLKDTVKKLEKEIIDLNNRLNNRM